MNIPADSPSPIGNPAVGPGEREFEELTRITSELITAQRQLHKQSAELRKLNEEKNLALGIVAHDLRNPLALIELESQFLLSESPGRLTEAQRELLQNICHQGRLMLTIVNDLLDVSAIDAGHFTLQVSSAKVSDLVERNVGRNALLAAEKRIPIGYRGPEREFDALIDTNKFEQVLNNLIGNAVKYAPSETEIDVSLQCFDDTFELRVCDHGPGIPAAQLERLFSPFTTAGIAASGGEKSTGLGLAIVRRIVEKHGGAINVQSTVGHGTCFQVNMPRRALSGSPSTTGTADSTSEFVETTTNDNSHVRRILIVDDSPAAAKMIARMLDACCQTVIEFAHDGQTALARVSEFQPDLVLLDIELPDFSGSEVAERLHQEHGINSPHLCAITGHDGSSLGQTSDQKHFNTILRKPVAIQQLRKLLSEVPDRRQPPREHH